MKIFFKLYQLLTYPIGLGGCYADQVDFDCCVYDITIFDGTNESRFNNRK